MSDTSISFKECLSLLRRRGLWLLLAGILGGAIAAVVWQGLPEHYTSAALLEVEAHSPLTREMAPAAISIGPDQVRTEADILQSQALAASVVRELNLATARDLTAAPRPPTWIDVASMWLGDAQLRLREYFGEGGLADPFANTLALFQRRLNVQVSEKSHIIAVGFKSGSPVLSAKVVNTLLTTYLSNQVTAKLRVAEEENRWLTEHLVALQHDVDDAAGRAQSFQEKNNLVGIQAGSLPALHLNENEQALTAARQDLARAQADYDTATTAHSATATGGLLGQEALDSQLIQRLREREAEALARVANLKQRFGEGSPYLRAALAELGAVREQIAGETAKIIEALGRKVTTARMRVERLEAMVAYANVQARGSEKAVAMLAQLNQEVDAKRHVFNAFLTRMEQTQLTSTQFQTGRVVSEAAPPTKPDGAPALFVAIGGGVGGILLATAAILLRHALGGRVSSVKDMELATGVTPIGSVPALPGTRRLPIATRILDANQSNMAETLHALSFAIQAMNPRDQCTRVLVTSPMHQEGKTTLAASLARLSAASGRRVLLIEADLRRPSLGQMLQLSSRLTIESVLFQGHQLADAVQVDPETGLHCVTASGSAPNAIQALQSTRFSALMDEAQANYDMVVMDSPPAMLVVDPLILSRYSDVILFAVAFGRLSASTVAEAFHRFPADVRSRVATVLTQVPLSEGIWHGYFAGYKRKLAAS